MRFELGLPAHVARWYFDPERASPDPAGMLRLIESDLSVRKLGCHADSKKRCLRAVVDSDQVQLLAEAFVRHVLGQERDYSFDTPFGPATAILVNANTAAATYLDGNDPRND